MKNALSTVYDRQRGDLQPVLTGITRDGFMRLLRRVAPHLDTPISKPAINTFAEMLAVTRVSDWTTPGSQPCCYAAQVQIAKRAGCSAGRVRAHENELQNARLIEKRTLGNGGRSGWQDRGIYFTPSIERLQEFLDIADWLDHREKRAATLRGLRSTHRKHLTAALLEITFHVPEGDEDLARLQEGLASWPRADRLHTMKLEDLERHEQEADLLCREALQILKKHEDSKGQPSENERSHIQDTTGKPESEICNASVITMPACKQADVDCVGRPPKGGPTCIEKDDRDPDLLCKSEMLEKLGPDRLYQLASEDMQMHLDVRRYQNGDLTFHDFLVAAQNRLPELGVNRSAWDDAVVSMGEDSAMMCVLILDANRDRPEAPVANPGGYLRALTRRAATGDLNLIGSLIGLSERKKHQ